jgi:quinol monooxygenase YgiN
MWRLYEMIFSNQAKIFVKEFKTDEFIGCIRALLTEFREEKGCLAYNLYQDIEKKNTYILVTEWKTRKAVEKHFQTLDFEVLIGAARVLCDKFRINITEVKEKGGYKLAMRRFKTPAGAPPRISR